MIRSLVLVASALLALGVGCGKSSKPGRKSPETMPDAGDRGASTGGAGARGGSGGGGRAGAEDGQEPSEGGTPSGGSSGASTSGAGGASAGGAGRGSGGSSTAGMAGMAGVTIPDGCSAMGQHVGGTYCSAEMTCGGRRLNVSCTEVASRWSCSCTDAVGRVDYDFPDARGPQTCAVAAKACADPNILTGDETCRRIRSQGMRSCAVNDTCDRLHDVDGVTLRTRRTWEASCETCGLPQAFCCSCSGPESYHRINDIDLSAGCDFMDELCSGDDIDTVGAKTCEPLHEYLYPGQGCGMAVECEQPAVLDDGTEFSLSEHYDTWCYVREEGLRCSSSDARGAYVFAVDFGMAPLSLATCRTTTAAAAAIEPVEATGEPVCTPYTDIVQYGACILEIDCVQPATIGSTAVAVHSRVGSQCELQADGKFRCFCNDRWSGPHVIEAEDSAIACPLATEACPRVAPPL